MFSDQILKDIKEHSIKDKTQECCGLIYSTIDGDFCYPSKNINDNKEGNFTIDPKDYLQASIKGQIKAVYHSHLKTDRFSEFDKLNSNKHNLIYIIYHIIKDCFLYYLPNQEVNKFIGREFKYGVDDCFSIVKDYYRDKLNIQIFETAEVINRNESWIKKGKELIQQMENSNTDFVEVKEIKENDIIIHKSNKTNLPAHFSIYIGNDCILHQKRNSYSSIEPFSAAYRNNIYKIFRHQSFV